MNKDNLNMNIKRFKPDVKFGLTDIEVNSRIESGLTNTVKHSLV